MAAILQRYTILSRDRLTTQIRSIDIQLSASGGAPPLVHPSQNKGSVCSPQCVRITS
jgi:hypothetical protein